MAATAPDMALPSVATPIPISLPSAAAMARMAWYYGKSAMQVKDTAVARMPSLPRH